jgi:hypothetical protein
VIPLLAILSVVLGCPPEVPVAMRKSTSSTVTSIGGSPHFAALRRRFAMICSMYIRHSPVYPVSFLGLANLRMSPISEAIV